MTHLAAGMYISMVDQHLLLVTAELSLRLMSEVWLRIISRQMSLCSIAIRFIVSINIIIQRALFIRVMERIQTTLTWVSCIISTEIIISLQLLLNAVSSLNTASVQPIQVVLRYVSATQEALMPTLL